ncbi:MAG TPA: hypothetical protein ENJ82_09020, partial [Bacteroidetes bacterium]|nr:hypothetical protein [Bacteroidota bacterium]
MKKSILICGIIGLCLHLPGQTFNSLIANGGNKKIEWKTSTSGNGYGHKIYNFDPGGKTLLKIAARHNSSSWTDLMTFTSNGKIGIGTTNPKSKFHLYDNKLLASAANSSHLLTRISGRSSNTFMNNVWLRRDAAGSSWLTTRLHDGISIDASYLTPGTNTKTWWERDPYNNVQS